MTTPAIDHSLRQIRTLVALQLLELHAIRINDHQPFRLVSGNHSPVYINCRQLISSPFFMDLYVAACRLLFATQDVTFNVIAGGETAGIPFAAFLAKSLGYPMVYVRKSQKAHGLDSRIEGVLGPAPRALLVEDLITDARSKLSFIEALQHAGAQVLDVVVVFDRLQGGREALHAAGLRLHALVDMNTALDVAASYHIAQDEELAAVRRYLESPERWHNERGLQFQR